MRDERRKQVFLLGFCFCPGKRGDDTAFGNDVDDDDDDG